MNDFRIYTRGVIFDKERKNVLLLKKDTGQKIAANQWLLPGGTVEFGEDIELSLIREIKEETNLSVESIQMLTIKKMIIQDTHWIGVYYLVHITSEDELENVEPEKHAAVKFVPLKEVPDFRDYTVLQFLKNVDSNVEVFDIRPPLFKDHAMGEALLKYVEMKIHNYLQINSDCFSRVRIIGNHDRSIQVSTDEKEGKLFNYQRPTVFIDGDILYISCFPGFDYIYHYANLVKSYFQERGEDKLISYVDTSVELIQSSLSETNLSKIPSADIIVYGNVDKLSIFQESKFKGDGDFMWKKGEIGGKSVILLGAKFSIWGDLGYYFIKELAKTSTFKTFVYVGKLGSLDESIVPNKFLATGSESYVGDERIVWRNIFSNASKRDSQIIEGTHVTCRSVMDETNDNVSEYKKKGSFIDPEIGNMARAAKETDRDFSYLHIISDNVVKMNTQNLSNERRKETKKLRVELFEKISRTIESTIASM